MTDLELYAVLTAFFALFAVLALLLSMPALDHTFSMGWSDGGVNNVSSSEQFTGEASIEMDFTIPTGNVVDQEETVGFLHTGIKAIMIVVTGNELATVTLETNSGSAPDDTLVFPIGGGRYYWDDTFPTIDGTSAAPFDAAVTSTFWTHNAAEEVDVQIRILYDS